MAQSLIDMTDYDEIHSETEIVFTATPEFDEHFNSIPIKPDAESSISKPLEQAHQDTEPACEQDAAAQDQVERLKAKLESNQSLRNSTENQAKQLRFRQLIKETRSLNKESEKFNTQSAVLLSALTNLKSEFEETEASKVGVLQELNTFTETSKTLLHELKLSKADTDESNARLQAIQQKSEVAVGELDRIGTESKAQQQTGMRLLNQLREDIETVASSKSCAIENSNNVIELASKSKQLLEQATEIHQQTSTEAESLKSALSLHEDAKLDLRNLSDSLNELRREMQQEIKIQTGLNEQSKSQIQQTEKLNEEQKTLIELTQNRHEELRNELTNSLETTKKYQSKLQLTENKLKDANQIQERYKEQYNEAMSKLESNETLLKNAAKALVDTNGQNGKFNSAIANFQHTTEQSQQLVLRTQTTLESILTRNQLLERENKVLAEKLNQVNDTPSISKSSTLPPRGGMNSLGDFNFTDPQTAQHPSNENKNVAFKFMVVLAILIPLSFIAYSVFNSPETTRIQQLTAEPNANLTRSRLAAK